MFRPRFTYRWWIDEKKDLLKRKIFGPPRFKHWYDIRSEMTEMYANTLLFWADNGVSYDSSIVETPEEWAHLLRSKGNTLLAWLENEDDPELYAQAQDVYRWTADNLSTLWD